MSLRTIEFEVDEETEDDGDIPRCARWIMSQPPRTRAEALRMCETAWGVISSQSSGEQMQKVRGEFEQCRQRNVAEIERLRLKLQECHTESDAEILMLQTQLENTRMGIQRKVEEEVKRMEDASRQLRSLECEAVHAKSRAEVENLSRENQQFRAQIENQHQHQREREDAVAEQQKRHLDEIRGFLADAKEEARRVRDEKERLHDKVELLHNEQRSFLSTMSGSSSSKGNLGESLVANAFSNLSRMGTLENTSKNQKRRLRAT